MKQRINFDDLFKKNRELMSLEEEKTWVNLMFNLYEMIGFRRTFQTPYEQYQKYEGYEFKILSRCVVGVDCDLETMPMWNIQILACDGTLIDTISAYPEEITKLETLTNPKNNRVKRIDYTCGYFGALKEQKTVLFDERDYTEEEIKRMINTDLFEKGVINCYTKDFEQAFRTMNPAKY